MTNVSEVRKGTVADIPFLVDAILYSERSGQDYCFYEKAFDLTEVEVRDFLKTILEENIPGSELCFENFNILFQNNKPVAALSSWIEGKGNQSSNFIKATIFAFVLPKSKWLGAQNAINIINEIAIERTAGRPQFESVYVEPDSRGQGFLKQLIDKVYNQYTALNYNSVEMISVINNVASQKAFKKCAFEVVEKTTTDNPKITKFLPGTGKILWLRS